MIFMLSGDFGHHALKPSGVALLIVLVTKEGVNHFVNQGALHLADIKVEVAKKLLRHINLEGSKVPEAAAIVATSCRRRHAGVPHHRHIGDLTAKVLGVEVGKHGLNVGLRHPNSPWLHSYITDAEKDFKYLLKSQALHESSLAAGQ
tara:strand:+ start:2462 stop:2902 length:441 start_codon:yes stop_codon:yes gene_type:complete